ncbi:site-specific DNA-methyltransferase [Escherichia coli]|nr:site-specific DNA-methyltransferase [Escherichia coli]
MARNAKYYNHDNSTVLAHTHERYSHAFKSDWYQHPPCTEEQAEWLIQCYRRRGCEVKKALSLDYVELQSEYKHLRRYFGVTAQVPYTDVWTHKPVQFYPGKHPCEKPAEMLQQIISASSRPGDLVADFFMGSGSTVKAALALGRRAIGVELETGRFEQTVREVQDLIV